MDTDVRDPHTENPNTEDLRRALAGDLLRPGDPGYDAAAPIWNGTVTDRPALIVRCAGTRDVVHALGFARDNGLNPAVRGGGHNVAGTGTCDGGMVIDLSGMTAVEVDADARLARVGGGARWADVDAATQEHGLAAPGGLVSKTGVGGLTLGGGLGWLRRKHGLSCDSLAAVEIVTADGQVRTASDTENPDLFWAIRGGGGNFGVVTRFDFNLFPVGPEAMFAFVFYPLEDGHEVIAGWRDFCERAPDEITSLLFGFTVPGEEPFPADAYGRLAIAVAAFFCGPVEDGQRALKPLRELAEPLCDFSEPMPYTEIQQILDEDYPDGMRYYWKSLYADRLGDDAIAEILKLVTERPSPLTTVDIWQLGGAMGRVKPDATAIGDRSAPWLFAVESNWEDAGEDDANRDWTRAAMDRLERFSTGESYVNFEPDTERGGSHDDGRLPQLAQVKRRYDPENVFRHNHNIAPA